MALTKAKINSFQSTLPRRERRYDVDINNYNLNFNPRSREGSDRTNLVIRDADSDFNPRSREGSDVKWFKAAGIRAVFQSTLPRRERQSSKE